MPPKAALKTDPLKRYLIGLSRELGMTYARLLREMGAGEVAEQLAYDELDADRRNKQAQKAKDATAAMRRR